MMNKRPLFLTPLLVTALTLSACGGNNSPAGPAANTGNIPNLATRPTPQASTLKKVRFNGQVLDSYSGKPIEKASILLQIQSEAAPATPAGTTGAPPNGSPATPKPNPSASTSSTTPPSPGATVPPGVGAPNIPPVPNGSSVTPPPPSDPDQEGTPPPAPEGAPPPAVAPRMGSQPLRIARLEATGGQSIQIAQATNNTANATTNGEKQPSAYRTQTNNQGKFWVNDIPDGTHTITISAPNYRTLTVVGVKPGNLEVPLTPINPSELANVTGMVLSPTDTPQAEVTVSPSFIMGDDPGIPAITNDLGEFMTPQVPFGIRSFAAFTLDNNLRIRQLGLETGIKISATSLKAKTPAFSVTEDKPSLKVSPQPSSDPDKRKALEEKVEDLLKPAVESPTADIPAEEPLVMPSAAASAPVEANPSAVPAAIAPPETPPSAPADAPNLPPAASEEEEEKDEKKNAGFNLFSTVGDLITGKKTTEEETAPVGSVYPVVVLRSVQSEVKLSGTVSIPEGYTLRGVNVFLVLKAPKEERPEEVYLFNKPLRSTTAASANSKDEKKADKSDTKEAPKGDQSFELELPTLEDGQSYHLQFAASAEEGNSLTYRHLYEQNKSADDLKVAFISPSTEIVIEGEDTNTIPLTPNFAWEPVDGAEMYRIQLEAGSDENTRIVWEAWTSGTTLQYPLNAAPGRLQEKEVYRLSVAAVKGLRPLSKGTTYIHPGYRAIWSDLAQTIYKPFEVVNFKK